MQLSEAIKLFLGDFIKTTARSYGQIMKDFVNHMGESFEIEAIEPVDLKRYMQLIDRRPSITSAHTYNKYVKTLKRFFNWCVDLELLETSPAIKSIKRKPADKKVRKEKDMRQTELDALTRLAQYEPRLLALVLFASDTGARRGAIARMQWADMNIDGGVAKATGKGSTYTVEFGDYTKMVLTYWKNRPDRIGDYVFSSDGNSISPDALGQYFRRRCIKAGIRSLGLHSLRHRLGHLLVENHPLSVAAKALGHRNQQITSEYYSPDSDERVSQARQQFFAKPPPETRFKILQDDTSFRDLKKRTAQ